MTMAMIGMLSHKSFGVPTLALAAGSVLARLWTDSLTPIVAGLGLAIVQPPLSSVVAVVLTIVPALLVMLRAPKVRGPAKRIMSGAVFALGAVALTYPAFESAVVLDSASKGTVEQMTPYLPLVITVCLALAVFEILFRKKKTKLPEGLEKQHQK